MNESQTTNEEPMWDELIQRHLLGTITADESHELEGFLLESPDARAQFRLSCNLDASLHQIAAASESDQPSDAESKETHVAEPVSSSRKLIAWACVAACAIGLLASLFWNSSAPSSVFAQVVHASEARLTHRADQLRVGEQLSLQELQLESGFLRLRLESGVLLELHAPLRADFESPMRMRLAHGRLSADVGRQGQGFTVVTDAGEIVDLGTQFAVEAGDDGESRVAVFSGAVKVRAASQLDTFTTLREGEAARFTARAGLRRWTQVALAVDSAGLSDVSEDGPLVSVRDNLGDAELHPFYGVVRRGMQPGALAFTDKPNPCWAPMATDTLPPWLQDADLVRMYHQFRRKQNYQLTLTLRDPADVFVLIDTRQEPPGWLKTQFTNTGETVRLGPWMRGMVGTEGIQIEADGQPYVTTSVWRAKATPGEFVLGPAHVDQSKKIPFAIMYGVAVKAHHVEESDTP